MKRLMAIVLLAMLAGCASWNWHDFGQSLMQSLCDSVEPCSVPCDAGDTACH